MKYDIFLKVVFILSEFQSSEIWKWYILSHSINGQTQYTYVWSKQTFLFINQKLPLGTLQ